MRIKHDLFLFISEIVLFAIHFYYGVSSFLEMLSDKFGIKLYFTLFWDENKHAYKYWDYMDKAKHLRSRIG